MLSTFTRLVSASAASSRSFRQHIGPVCTRLARNSSCSSSSASPAAKMRFIQFQQTVDGKCTNAVGLISECGSEYVNLSALCPHLADLGSILRGGETALAKLQTSLTDLKWTKLTDDVRLLAPVARPEKVVCIGLNYAGHCREQNKEPPTEPMFFSKFNNAITGPFGDVVLHRITDQVDWEVELAVVIGKTAKSVPLADAMDYVFGYTVAQDISARDWQKTRNGGQFLIGKSMDTFCPLGPAVVHKSLVPDPHCLRIRCSVNGVPKQDGNTSELVFRIDQIIHLLSQSITLQPGDVILTGTPAGVGMHRKPAEFLKDGDLIESEIESIGTIRNRAVAE